MVQYPAYRFLGQGEAEGPLRHLNNWVAGMASL
jgi:hypothetical protein